MASLEDRVRWNRNMANTVNPVDFYREHYTGLTRGQLARQDQNLYRKLLRDGLLEHVPTADISKVGKKSSKFGTDPVAYYRQHHAGLTRGQLKKQDRGLYEKLRRDGLLEHVPVSSRFGSDPVAYYHQHHAGLTRGKLKVIDPILYERLRRNGLLDQVPKKS